MLLDGLQQIAKTIQTKTNIFVTTRANPDGDAISSALAFYLLAQGLGKKVHCAIDTNKFGPNQTYAFLHEFESINNVIPKNSDITLEFDLNQKEINGLTYKVQNNKLLIRIFPKEKNLTLSMPQVIKESYEYDLIVVVDSCDLDSLGSIYNEHVEFFYHTPIINIDHQSENEHFGELNLVELTAVATTEILFTLTQTLGTELLDSKLCTCLLAGIIYESKSFQTPNITPRSLAIASELMSLGANRELIIENLFYNKPVCSLQLWGRILANLEIDKQNAIAWSVMTKNDFEQTSATEQTLLAVVDDLLLHAPESKIVIVLYEKDKFWTALIHTHEPNIDLRKQSSALGCIGTKNLVTCDIVAKDSDQAIELIMSSIVI